MNTTDIEKNTPVKRLDNDTTNETTKLEQPKNTPSGEQPGGKIGVVIIVIVFIIGGLYYWGKNINNKQVQELQNVEKIVNTPDKSTQTLEKQSSSNKVSAIENDLNATNLNGLDAELNDIGNSIAP
ncbi:MAG TPA: hypothetical protein ENI66_00540 [Candidatus Yonathbacteria bacterium]|nr:hypothetical protein [Candidatus Yonathbacteria bacterium]